MNGRKKIERLKNRRVLAKQSLTRDWLGIAKMKKIPGVAKPPGIFLPTALLWNAVESEFYLVVYEGL